MKKHKHELKTLDMKHVKLVRGGNPDPQPWGPHPKQQSQPWGGPQTDDPVPVP
jgi:hypothetical protein